MIDPISAAMAAEALAGITSAMAGMDLATAWTNQGMSNPDDLGFGVQVDTSTTPAVSGDTSGSIINSQQTDPVDAWNDYVLNNPGSVDSTTGGVVSGSGVSTFAYSLLQTYPEAGTEVVRAVVPVAVPLERAYVAISQALGVAMNTAEMDVQTRQAFANSLANGNNLVYDQARNLVKAWWDGVQILFPRETVEAVQNTIDELEIGEGGEYTRDEDYYVTNYTMPVPYLAGGYVAEDSTYIYNMIGSGGCVPVSGGGYFMSVSPGRMDMTRVVKRTGQVNLQNTSQYLQGTTRLGNTFYYYPLTGNLPSAPGYYVNSKSNKMNAGDLADIVLFGTPTGSGYPDGTQASDATAYTPSTIPSAGGIATSPTDTTDVVPINLPTDATDTTGSTADPVTTPTDSDDVDTLPAPPIPLPIPDTKPSNPEVPLVNPSVIDSTRIEELVEELANTLDPQPGQSSGIIPVPPLPGIIDPTTGQSTFPSIIPDSGPGFIHVYNPTPAEFVAFGAWLWVTYADATIDKILNNPFDGVIGAHELYATPNRGGTDNIRSAFLVCPTTAALVPNRYSEIDCGTVIVPEFYGNYLDYSPYSQAYIYLPFIGINEVSIDDIVGHAVNIRYRIDSYSGSCIAMIFVAKDGYQNLCYQFAGSCSVEVPMAGGSQAAIKAAEMQAEAYARAAMTSAVGHLFGGIGSALMGSLGGTLSSMGGIANDYAQAKAGVEAARVANKSSVQHSGQFGASHGAMGQKIPFIIIRNPIQVKVVNYNDDYGFPAHKRVIIGGCTGYLRVREVNVISAHATDDEKAAIEALLKNGVYVS